MDYIIQDASIIDGTGQPGFNGDIGIRDGLIAAIGKCRPSEGTEVIDAKGCIVTPGFVDVHTHYDGQVTWDDTLEPSLSHGVTTLIMGNCGVGFAPVRVQDKATLIDLMEGVEDIPGTALSEGMPWGRWETFPQYMDFLETRRFTMDVGCQIPHGALRYYVMGERGMRNESATAAEIEQMAKLTREAMEAGALGFTTSRTVFHRSLTRDQPVPGTFASDVELGALVGAVGASGRGVVEAISSGAVGHAGGILKDPFSFEDETVLFGGLSRLHGVPITFTTIELQDAPDLWRKVVERCTEENATGAKLHPQIAPRALSILQGLSTYHLFQNRPTYKKLAKLPREERAARMRNPEIRDAILGEADEPASIPIQTLMYFYRQGLTRPNMFLMTTPVDYEPSAETAISNQVAASGKNPEAFLYDLLLENSGSNIFMHLAANYVHGNLDATREMLDNDMTIVGLGDAGAHVNFICDASNPTVALSHWAQRRNRGPRLSLEQIVRKLTSVNADLYGMRDRGRVKVGLRADLNVIDMNRLSVFPPSVTQDLPAGGSRLMQKAAGYLATFVAGQAIRREGEDTGRRPGRLVRSGPTH